MKRGYGMLAVGSALLLSGGLVTGGAWGASPSQVTQTSIRLVNADGFVPVSEEVIAANTVVDTFRSADTTIRLIGRPGSTISMDPGASDNAGTLQVHLSASRPKTAADAHAYADSGRTVVGDLVALGMPRREAERQFGDMETVDGHNPYLADAHDGEARALPRSGSSSPATVTAATASGTTPYDVLCVDINAHGGKIVGRGCSTLFLVVQNGSDWWFNNKYKLSVHSTDTSFPFPLRLTLAAWDIRWATGNVVYDWDPTSEVPVGSCTTVTASISDKGGISISGTVCPNVLDVWTLSSTRSGAQWTGTERGTQWEVALGVQAVHSPPTAPASYASTLGLACVNC